MGGKEIALANRAWTSAWSGLLLMGASHTARAQPYFTGLDELNGSNGSMARGISPEGRVVSGENYWPILYSEVTRWAGEDGGVSITPGRASSTDGGTSWDGRVMIGNFPGNGTNLAFRWTAQDGAIEIGDLDGGILKSLASGISARGDVIVGVSGSSNSNWEAFRWTPLGGMVGLGDLPGGQFISGASAISADGLVIVGGGSSRSYGSEAYRWTEASGMVGLGFIDGGGFNSSATAVSADGSVVVGIGIAEGQRAFRWTEQTGMVALEKIHPDQDQQTAEATSWDGNVIVGQVSVSQGPFGPYYWTPVGGTRWLTDVLTEHGVVVPDGWHLGRAYGVSADGRTIVGSGTPPEGEVGGGWVAYLGPACRADYDDDGSVNTADVIAYLGAWAQRSIFADWNYDGSIDTRDVIGFLGEWVAKPGC